MIYGADISEWQGDPDWDKACAFFRAESLEFLMLRTEDGLHHDGRFGRYCAELARREFSELGTYPFFRAGKPVRPQVEWAVLCHGDLPGPLAVDFETLDNQIPEHAADALQEALETLTAAMGRLPAIYTDPHDWMALGAYSRSHHFERYPLWIANVETSKPLVPAPWSSWDMWQYTWKRKIPGFATPVDGDVFRGSLADWHELGRPAAAPTDPAPSLSDLDRDPDSTPTGR